MNVEWDYEGELDEKGKACGFGVAIWLKQSYKGCFFNDTFEGIGVQK